MKADMDLLAGKALLAGRALLAGLGMVQKGCTVLLVDYRAQLVASCMVL